MTYIIGIKNSDTSVIITDSRVSFDEKSTNAINYSLKSGLLFPGCIYGYTGYTKQFRDFVECCKSYLTTDKFVTLEEYWERFTNYVNSYDFNKKYDFEILISSRHSKTPNFYILDSKKGYIEKIDVNLVTLGSGKKILDDEIQQYYRRNNEQIIDEVQNSFQAPLYFFAYYYCLRLMELSQGEKYNDLESHGVGVFFNFSYQAPENEHRQHPAVYVIANIFHKTRKIIYTLYRITFEKMALVIENGADRKCSIAIDSAASPFVASLSKQDLEELKIKIIEGSIKQPFYNYLGLGFAQTEYRGSEFHCINNDENYLIERNSINSEIIINFVECVMSGNVEKFINQSKGNKKTKGVKN